MYSYYLIGIAILAFLMFNMVFLLNLCKNNPDEAFKLIEEIEKKHPFNLKRETYEWLMILTFVCWLLMAGTMKF